MVDWKKVATCILYPVQVPFGVWAGYEFAISNWLLGGILTISIMLMEGCAVWTWMDAQCNQTVKEIQREQLGG